jgi:hypothetical protein
MFLDNSDDAVSLSDYDIERLAKAVGVLRYDGPINSCALCGMPTSGVFCLDCATS